MRLVEEGVIGLDDPVGRHISWRIPVDGFDSDEVTVRRLLSHTAGLGLGGYSGFIASVPDTKTALDAQKDFCCLLAGTWAPGAGDTRVVHAPGTMWSYSGGGYHVLQLLLEEVHKRPFADVMEDRVLRPLGMRSSSFWAPPTGRIAGNVAESRCLEDNCANFTDSLGRLPNYVFSAASAAGLYSNAEDFMRFIAAHMDTGTKPLSAATLDAMLAPQPNSDNASTPQDFDAFGLGYELTNVPVALADGTQVDLQMAAHDGSNLGWKLVFAVVPEAHVGIAVHTNGEGGRVIIHNVTAMFKSWLAGGLARQVGGPDMVV